MSMKFKKSIMNFNNCGAVITRAKYSNVNHKTQVFSINLRLLTIDDLFVLYCCIEIEDKLLFFFKLKNKIVNSNLILIYYFFFCFLF